MSEALDGSKPDDFDRAVAETFELMEGLGRNVRPDVIGLDSESKASSPARAGAWLFVSKALETDPEVMTYNNPSVEELRVILARATAYSGDWYHSRVTLLVAGELSDLEVAVTELPVTAGVFLSYQFVSKEAMMKHLGIPL